VDGGGGPLASGARAKVRIEPEGRRVHARHVEVVGELIEPERQQRRAGHHQQRRPLFHAQRPEQFPPACERAAALFMTRESVQLEDQRAQEIALRRRQALRQDGGGQ